MLIDPNRCEAETLQLKIAESRRTRFTVETVTSLAEASDRLLATRFDVVLADLEANLTGSQALTDLQARTGDAPIIVITGNYQEAKALEAVRAGAQDYVAKDRLNAAAVERILLHAIERERAHRRTSMLYSISRVLADSDSRRQARLGLLMVLCEFLEFDVGFCWSLDPISNELVPTQSWQFSQHDYSRFIALAESKRLARGEGLPGRAWAAHGPVWLHELNRVMEAPVADIARTCGLQSACAFPITVNADVLGVVELFSRELKEADDDLSAVLNSIGSQAGQFSARKIAEEERERLTNERLQILDSASEGIYGIDRSGNVSFMNRAAAKMFHCEQAEVLGRNSHKLFHHSYANGSPYLAEQCPIARVLRDGEGTQSDKEHFWRTDGSSFAVEYSALPIFAAGTVTGAVVSFSDISRRKQMEVELRHAQKLEAVGSLAAGIAHEINTPIQFVSDNTHFVQDAFTSVSDMVASYERLAGEAKLGRCSAETLEEAKAAREKADWEYLRQEVPKALEQAMDGLARVAKIVRAMKEFSHVDQSSEKSAADINRALESTLVVARNELKYVAEVQTQFGDLPPVVCHLGDLNQVFLNLLVNAAHAIGDVVKGTNKKGLIAVCTRHDGAVVEISVSDTGTGIPEAIRHKVFDPFFTTKEVGKGTGQGLALAHSVVVEKHGGTLTFDSETGKGTTFYVRLPADGVAGTNGAVS